MNSGINSWTFAVAVAVAVAGALAAPAAVAQTIPEQVQVKRPDGTVVYPPAAAPVEKRTSWSKQESDRADDRERRVIESQSVTDARIEQSRRQREAANTNPAREVPPSTGR